MDRDSAGHNGSPAGLPGTEYQSGVMRLKGELQTPTGKGPFPAVIYLHGGVPPKVGGDPAATRRRDLKAIVMMAPAPGNGALARFLPQASRVTGSTLILVASNDTRQADHVALSRQTHAALEKAGKPVRLVVYPAFGRDGHLLFFQVRQPYWADVLKFLREQL